MRAFLEKRKPNFMDKQEERDDGDQTNLYSKSRDYEEQDAKVSAQAGFEMIMKDLSAELVQSGMTSIDKRLQPSKSLERDENG